MTATQGEDISFVLQAAPDAGQLPAMASRAESLGFETLCTADHPGLTVSPFAALAAAAPSTQTIRLGTAVVNAGVRDPFDIASDVATLDLLSDGRALLGLGAGSTPSEWTSRGREYPSPGERIEHLSRVIPVIQGLLAGDHVHFDDPRFSLVDAHLNLIPANPIPLLVGGNSQALVRVGARYADIVEIGGLGPTLPDGYLHEVRWKTAQIERVVAAFHDAAGEHRPRLGALVQLVALTDDAEGAAQRFLADIAERIPSAVLLTIDDLLSAPFVLIGTVDEIVDKVLHLRDRWGIVRYTVRAPSADDIAAVLFRLTGGGSASSVGEQRRARGCAAFAIQ
jgi:probable F420-dependent oxidoreductase